jgi:acetyl-CoA carboxylase carboxyl transferase subunit beta
MIYKKKVAEAGSVCPKCDHHFTLTAEERISQLLDTDSFEEWFSEIRPTDPLDFRIGKPYLEKLRESQQQTRMLDAALTGRGRIEGHAVAFGCTDPHFLMGSMGSVVGEKITRTVERAGALDLPLILVSGSGGGARMQEGAYSLMQMTKISSALKRFRGEGGLYLSILTNPTMGGVMASFASLGDLILAEPKALLGFTGPRVIQQTIRAKLPEGFQSSEFMLEHGQIDRIVHRKDLRRTLAQILELWSAAPVRC